MSLKVFPTQEKITDSVDGVATELTDCRAEFVTGQKTRSKRVSMDTIQKAAASISTANAIEAGSTDRMIKKTAHGVKAGDLIRFTDNDNAYVELNVKHVIDADWFVLDGKLLAVPAAGDLFDHLIYITQRASTLGAMPVDVISSVLPTGASTSALQTSGNTSLTNIYNQALLRKNSLDYFTQNFATSTLADTVAVNTNKAVTNVKKINVQNNSGFMFELAAVTTLSKCCILAGFSGDIDFQCGNEVINLTNISGVLADSGMIAINFIKEA